MNEDKQNKGVDREAYEFKMDALQMRIDQIERKISHKADEVVNIQIMHHRQEIEEMCEAIEHIDQQMKKIEKQIEQFNRTSRETLEPIDRKDMKLRPLFGA